MQVQYKKNEIYLCQETSEPDLYVINEVSEAYINVSKLSCIKKLNILSDHWMKGEDFHKMVKNKYGVLGTRRFLFFEWNYVTRC